MEKDNEKRIAIIGGGPAGVSAALYTKRAGIDTTLIVHGESALEKAENIENYYGFPDGISGSELFSRGIAQAQNLGITVKDEEVVGLGFEEMFAVKTNAASYDADAVIIAMGQQRNAPDIEGIKEFEGHGVSYCAVCDGFFYRGKTVAVLGNGEYAANERAELEPLAETVIALEDEMAIMRFSGSEKIEHVEFKDGSSQDVDGLFIACGTAGPGDIARKIGIFTDGQRITVDGEMATNVPGIFAAGDCTGGPLQVSKAVADGAVAATSAIKYVRSIGSAEN